MKKTFIVLIAVLAMFAFVSCASTKGSVAGAEDWWNNPPVDTKDIHYEIGYAKGTNLQTSRDWAKANANTAVAQYVSNSVTAIVNTYSQDAGELATDNMQALQAFESVSQQKAEAVLVGVTYKYAEQADGSVYVLACVPIGTYAEELKATVKETFSRNAASVAAMDAMDEAIDKYFN